jgi:hypothetical protein
LGYFTDFWEILLTFGIFYDHLAQFVSIWYIFSGFDLATLVSEQRKREKKY